VGAFSHKFIIASSGETTAGIKKVKGCKNGTDLLYPHAKYGGNPGSRAGCRGKSVMFFCLSVFLSRFWMTKFVITETLWSSISFKTIIVSFHRGRFVVKHLCSSFPIDTKNSSRGQIFTKNYHFWRFLHAGVVLGLSAPGKILQKSLKRYTPLGKIYTKNYHCWRFFGT